MSTEIVEAQPRSMVAESAAPAANSPMGMMLAAVQQGASLEQVEKMMDLQERWEANEARKAYVAAMAAFKAEPIAIIKRKRVSFPTRDGGDAVSYSHAELSDVTDAIGPAMAKHDLSFRWDLHQASDGRVTVDCIITHIRGHSETVTMSGSPDTSGKKNLIQQSASTVTYLQRYTLLAATGMSTKGQDNDGMGGDDGEALDWLAKVDEVGTLEDLDAALKEGSAFLTKQKGPNAVGNYRAFMAAVQSRNKALKGNGNA